MKKHLQLAICFLLIASTSSLKAQITVTTVSPNQAINVILNTFLAPSGVNPSSVQNVTFTGMPGGLATFTGTSSLGFVEGVILSTDNSNYIDNPASAQISSTQPPFTCPGDPQLNALFPPTGVDDTTESAAVLQFDFEPFTDTLRFRYVFASEEYTDYTCSPFNDVFGFFISGPNPAGGNYNNLNIATVPGTNLPVAIGTINSGTPSGFWPASGCQSLAYSNLYVNNSNGTTIIFDGHTVVLEAKIAVKICGTYHLKLAIGNRLDPILDSGVFLEAHSFGGGIVPIGITGGAPVGTDSVFICPGQSVTLTAANAVAYNWGSATDTLQTFVADSPGVYYCFVNNPSFSCFQVSEEITVLGSTPYAHIDPLGPFTLCPGDSVQLVANSDSAYLWNTGATTQSIWASQAGNYVVTVTDTAGCGTDTSNVVNVFAGGAAANITATGSVNLCPGDDVLLTANPGTSYIWSNGETTQSITVSIADTFTVTVFQTGCSANSPPVITTLSNPVATISPPGPHVFCQGNSVNLSANTGTGFTYLWNNGTTASGLVVDTTGNFTVTVTDAFGCSAVSSLTTVTVNSASATVTILGNDTICQGDSVQLNANAGNSYLWNNGATTQQIYVNQNGSFNVTVTNFNTCVAVSLPENINVSQPIANITYTGNTTICPNSSIQLNANAGSSYAWSNGLTSQSIIVNAAGTYTVVVTNNDNCSASASLTIGVSNPVSTITPAGNTTFCDGDNVVLNANNGSSYLWSNGETTQSITVNQAGNYTVIVTDNWGCTAISLPENIVVNFATASITLSGDNLLCPGEQVALTANPGIGFLWSNGETTQSINVNATGTYSVTVTNANSCTAVAAPESITVSQPTATITPQGNINICPNATLGLSANAGIAWLWSNGESTQTINVSGNGNYIVTVTNSDNCTASSAPLATVQSNPTASITPQGPTTFCSGEQVILSANPGTTFQWSNGESTSSITVYNGGNYTVTVTNNDNCTAVSAPQNVVVNFATAVAQPGGATSFCEGDSVIITSDNAISYLWNNGSTSQTIYVSQTGNYYVVATAANGCTATSNAVHIDVRSYPEISFTTDSTRECNTLKVKFINGTITEANSTYFWDFGDGQTSFSVSPVHTFDSLGTFIVVLTVNSPFGCESSDSVEIKLEGIPDPIAKFKTEPEPAAALFASEIKFINESQNAVRYHWNFGDNSGSNEMNPTHAYKDPGVYTVILESLNEGGCKDYYELQLPVAPFFIPSAFTPNNDGKNDVFPSLNYGLEVQNFEMSIWNRWGARVFVTTDPLVPFRGKDQEGNVVASGIYYYLFNMTTGSGKPYKFEGSINLFR